MSNLRTLVQHKLKTQRHFTFLGSDGCLVQANDLDGVLAVHVIDQQGKTLFDHYTDFKVLLKHLEMHGGHIH